MKKDVMAGCLASLFDGKGGNEDSSPSLSGPSPKLATFLPWFCGSTFSVVTLAACISCFNGAFAFSYFVGDSMGFELVGSIVGTAMDLAVCYFSRTILSQWLYKQ